MVREIFKGSQATVGRELDHLAAIPYQSSSFWGCLQKYFCGHYSNELKLFSLKNQIADFEYVWKKFEI